MQINTHSGAESLRTVSWRTDNPDATRSEYYRDRLYSRGFSKPSRTVKNPLVNGYRKPSSYSCPAFNQLGNQWNFGIVVPYKVEGYFEYPDGSWPWSWVNTYSGQGAGFVSVSIPSHNVNNVRMKLLNNVRGEILDVAMLLAEVSGTANTLGNTLMRLARSMDAVKKRKPENFFYLLTGRRRDRRRPTDKFLRETASTYLEWKYGVMPTIFDIQGLCQGLDMSKDGSLFDNPPLLVGRAVDKTESVVNTTLGVSMPGGAHGSFPIKMRVKSELKARIDYKVSGEGLRGLNRYGVGLSSVATVAFDKTPFSFVLNMAVPIADLLKAWTALAGCDVLGYSETTYREASVIGTTGICNLHGVVPLPTTVDSAEKAYVDWHRTAYHSPPMPLPYVRNPVKVGNIATVLSLFTTLRKSQ